MAPIMDYVLTVGVLAVIVAHLPVWSLSMIRAVYVLLFCVLVVFMVEMGHHGLIICITEVLDSGTRYLLLLPLSLAMSASAVLAILQSQAESQAETVKLMKSMVIDHRTLVLSLLRLKVRYPLVIDHMTLVLSLL